MCIRDRFDIVNTFSKEHTIRVRLDKNGSCILTSGKARVKIGTLPVDDFPEFLIPEIKVKANVDSTAFASLITRTHFACTTDETRSSLFGVAIELDNKGNGDLMTMVATDTHRLNIAKTPCTITSELPSTVVVIIPKKSILEIKKIIERGDVDIEIAQKGTYEFTHLKVTQKDTVFMTRLVQGRFPNWSKIIPDKNPIQVTLPKQEIINALKRVAVLSKEKSHSVYFSFTSNLLTIKAANESTETGEEELDIKYARRDISIGLNVKFLQESLAVIEGDQVAFHMLDERSQVLVTDETNDSYQFVLMPLRDSNG